MLIKTLSLALLIILVNGELLLQKGWYKSWHRAPKKVLSKVRVIDNTTVPNTPYLRIKAVIPSLFPGSVRNLNRVKNLTLVACGIRDILPGAFENLPNLTRLELKENAIEHVKEGVFNNLNIAILHLHKNQIKVIDPKAFDDMLNLNTIKLNSNKLKALNSEWFRNTPSLTEVYLRRNNIGELPEGAFKNIKGFHVIGNKEIVDAKIFLSKNKIRYVNPMAFYGIDKIGQIWLDRNKISKLDEDIFSGTMQIDFLNLAKNYLKELPENLFENTQVKILDVTSNRNITCLPLKVVAKVNLTDAFDIKGLDCDCVGDLYKKLEDEHLTNEIKSDQC